MKCVIMATKIAEHMYPLTKEVPVGLLDLNGKPALEWILDETEAAGDLEYLVATCAVYEPAVLKWKNNLPYGEKITVITVPEKAGEEEIVVTVYKEKELKEDVMVIPGDTVLYLSLEDMIAAWRESEEPVIFGRGNKRNFEELPIHFYTEELFSTGESFTDREDWKRVYMEGYCDSIRDLAKYEDLQNTVIGEAEHNKFGIQTYTQERYGDIFISRISMDRNIGCKKQGQAELLLHNKSQKILNPDNTKLTYSLWIEEPIPGTYDVQRISMNVDDVIPLPATINPGEEARIKVDVKVPGYCGKYYVKFDLEIEGEWIGKDANYLLFPTVSFSAEPAHEIPAGALQAQPKILFVGMPESANGGEHLEAAALKEYVQKLYPERLCLEYPARNVEEYWRNCSKIVHPDDLVFPYGSGFMGMTEKMAEEHFARRTASSVAMPKIRLRMFISPTHEQFSKVENGMEEVGHSAVAYGGTNYYLYGANEADYQFFLENFPKTNVAKAPLLSLGKEAVEDRTPTGDDFTVVVCGESREGFLDTTYEAIDKNDLHRMYLNLDYNAYQPGAFFGKTGRDYLMKFCCDTILDTKAVVTDNHYGLGYALMCNRPCVVYGTDVDKEWFSDRDDVIFIDKLEEIEGACKEILKRTGKGPLKEEYYLPLKRQILM